MEKGRCDTIEKLRCLRDEGELSRRFPDEGELIYYLYDEEKLSQRQIGTILGRSQWYVRDRMQRYDIKARSLNEAMIIAHSHAGHVHPKRCDKKRRKRGRLTKEELSQFYTRMNC